MWIPSSIAALEEALERGELEEHARLDLKRALPAKAKGRDIAVDVAAMANDGGLIIYGVGEDASGRPVELVPIVGLRAARERIDQVVQHSLAGPPRIRIRLLPLSTDADEGHLIVEVPPSPQAPHMVLATHAFYGRGAAGNRPLEAAEIDRLYARRARWDIDRERLLDQALSHLPFPAGMGMLGAAEGLIVLVCRPVAADPDLLGRLRAGADGRLAGPESTIVPVLERAQDRCVNRAGWVPALSQLREWAPAPEGGFIGATHRTEELREPRALSGINRAALRRYLSVQVDGDGTVRLACGRATDDLEGVGLLVAEGLIAVLCAQGCAAGGALLTDGGYFGAVDLALHVDGLARAVSWRLHGPRAGAGAPRRAYGRPVFRAHQRVDARALADTPIDMAAELVTPLTRVTAGEWWDPVGTVRP